MPTLVPPPSGGGNCVVLSPPPPRPPAVDEIVEIDHSEQPPTARLTKQARSIARGLLGRPKEAQNE
ncbi:hypothetical protein HYZ99_03495 [Candidatus Peregrinibacteria bacterium]|nr:hypothetical protein [Candidatus Peregrinibacteria bacterium]